MEPNNIILMNEVHDPTDGTVLGLLKRARDLLAVEAYGQSYGYFLGGDPRNFTPDYECSTEAERACHAADCAAWDRGEHVSSPNGCEVMTAADAGVDGPRVNLLTGESRTVEPGSLILVARCSYGLGVTAWRDEEAVADLADLNKLIARMEGR